jgi:hypothetical protein
MYKNNVYCRDLGHKSCLPSRHSTKTCWLLQCVRRDTTVYVWEMRRTDEPPVDTILWMIHETGSQLTGSVKFINDTTSRATSALSLVSTCTLYTVHNEIRNILRRTCSLTCQRNEWVLSLLLSFFGQSFTVTNKYSLNRP